VATVADVKSFFLRIIQAMEFILICSESTAGLIYNYKHKENYKSHVGDPRREKVSALKRGLGCLQKTIQC
jgi:hypothetical protein